MKNFTAILFCLALQFCGFAQGVQMPVYVDTVLATHNSRPFVNGSPLPVAAYNMLAIPANHYTQHLGFFCRQELKMQQVTVPVTFRLGSMDQCNYLEQKPGYKN